MFLGALSMSLPLAVERITEAMYIPPYVKAFYHAKNVRKFSTKPIPRSNILSKILNGVWKMI